MIAPLAFGTAALGNLGRARDEAACDALVHAVLDAGIDHVDTAPLYGHGLAERRLGRVLAERARRPRLSTKVGRRLEPPPAGGARAASIFVDADPFEPVFDYSADGVRRSLDGSLARLGVDHIDVVLVHDLGALTHGDAHPRHLRAALDGAFPALEAMKRDGAIGVIGVGVNEIAIVDELLGRAPIDVVLLAGRHTLIDRTAERAGALTRWRARGVEIMLGGVFNSGLLIDPEAPGATLDYRPAREDERAQARRWRARAEAAGLDLPAAALAFARAAPGVARVLVGPGDLEEWRRLQAWAGPDVPADLFSEPVA